MPFAMSFDGPVLIFTLSGKLSGDDLQGLADQLIAIEQGGTRTPPRLTDLRGISEMAIGYPEMARLADRARSRPLRAPIRSALVVGEPVQLGYARMFQILNEHPDVTVRIFDDESAARAWLAGGADPSDPTE